MAPKEEKKTKRSQVKYPALDPSVNLKTRYELIADYDYLDKLSPNELDWLNRFTEETVNANFNHKGKKIVRTAEGRRKAYGINNARNRCIWTRAKACGQWIYTEDFVNDAIRAKAELKSQGGNTTEDDLIRILEEDRPSDITTEDFLNEIIELQNIKKLGNGVKKTNKK